MKKLCFLLIFLVSLAFCSTTNASITNAWMWADGDGAIVCTNYLWGSGYDNMSLYGDQYDAPGHIFGTILTDTAEDPTLTIRNALDNDTSFAWTAYHVNVFLNTNFTLSAATVYTPGGWTPVITAQAYWNGTQWQGELDYYGGPAVGIGSTFDFGYKMTFSGLTSFTFCQELIPVPEPSTMGLVAIGGLLLARFASVRGRRRG